MEDFGAVLASFRAPPRIFSPAVGRGLQGGVLVRCCLSRFSGVIGVHTAQKLRPAEILLAHPQRQSTYLEFDPTDDFC
jgi:hypothetical protein